MKSPSHNPFYCINSMILYHAKSEGCLLSQVSKDVQHKCDFAKAKIENLILLNYYFQT